MRGFLLIGIAIGIAKNILKKTKIFLAIHFFSEIVGKFYCPTDLLENDIF